jgi:hypothetical protein
MFDGLSGKSNFHQSCQIFLYTMYQNGGKYTKVPQITKGPYNVPNGRNTFQMAKEHTNLFHFKALPNLPKLGFWV